MATKKIFVLGNGFDLAHYLPTMYVHFMEAMKVIESSDDNKELGFDELFAKYNTEECSADDKVFFDRVKEIYKTENLKVTNVEAASLKEKLKNNGWFQHFKHHLSDIDTWIDFENEIEKSLKSFDLIFNIDFNASTISNSLNNIYSYNEPTVDIKNILENERVFNLKVLDQTGLKAKALVSLLKKFGILKQVYGHITYEKERRYGRNIVYMKQESNRLTAESYEMLEEYKDRKINDYTTQTNTKKYFDNIVECKYLNRNSDLYVSFKEIEVYKKILEDLDVFSDIFSSYIDIVINKLEPSIPFQGFEDSGEEISMTYTFNYSNTFERLYGEKIVNNSKVQYIHGSAIKENIVLGISDLDDNLKKYKIYGFVKTFQKILKNTDFMFLDHDSLELVRSKFIMNPKDKCELIIWGHSLDSSDSEYIREIFNLNQSQMAVEVVVKVWYHDSSHKQLANLMYIMGKDIIQKWTKQGWLIFEKAPELYKPSAS